MNYPQKDEYPQAWQAFEEWDRSQTPFCGLPPLDKRAWISFLSGWQCCLKATPRAAPQPGGCSQGMTTAEIQKLAELIHWNPKAWHTLRQAVPATEKFRSVEELVDKLRIITNEHTYLLDLNTCAIDRT